MRVLSTFALICLLALTGCSYSFDVRAVMIDGRLAFVPAPQSRKAECISRVMVREEGPPAAQTFEAWMQSDLWVDQGGYDCTDRFPLFYGEALKGNDVGRSTPSREVAPKALRVGTIYEVMIVSGATGYGGGRFRLLPGGRVENLGRPVLIGEDAPLMTPPD